jgi:hypothetical protein
MATNPNKPTIRQAINASMAGKPVPIMDIVRTHTSTAAMVSKLVESKIRQATPKDNDGNTRLDTSNIPALYEYSRIIAERSDNSEQVMTLFPETELAAQILISSVISPKDMTKGDVIITAPDNLKSVNITAMLLAKIRDYFEKVYKIKSELPEILRNVLIEAGSDPRMVIPENSIDDIINGSSKITLEALSDFIDTRTKEFKPLGLLGNPTTAKTHDYVQESIAYSSGFSYNPVVNLPGEKAPASGIKIIDNFAVLRLPEINEKNRKAYVQEAIGRGSLGINAHSQKAKAEATADYNLKANIATKLSDTDVRSLFYKRKFNGSVPVRKVRPDSEMTRRTVGAALKMKLPAESVIPVYTPGDVKKHVAYLVLLDAAGYPLSKESNAGYVGGLPTNLGKKTNNMSSYWLNKANVQLNGRDCSIHEADQAMRAFKEVIESEISARIRNGIDGVSATIADNDDVYRLMLARQLANEMTQVLYVPAELMTYFSYKYDKNGIGISLLENNRLLNSLRAMLLFSKVMAQTRNAIGLTKVEVKLDPEDPDPYKTATTIKHAYAKSRSENFPIGATSPTEISDWLQRAGLMFSYSGHPGMPDMEVNAVESNRSFGMPDNDLEDELRKRTVMSMGLTPETVDAAFSPEFARAVTTNNVLLAKRIIQIQEAILPQLTDHIRKVAMNDGNLVDEIKQIIIENYDELLSGLESEDDINKIRDNKDLVVKMVMSEFLSNIEATLPEPDSTTLDNQLENLNKYIEAVDIAIKAYIDSSFFTTELAGDTAESADSIGALLKAYFIRKYMAENNIMPEIAEVIKDVFDPDADNKFVQEQSMHINYLSKAIISIMAGTKDISAAADKDLPAVKSGEQGAGGDFGSSFGGGDTSSDTGGSDNLDDMGLGGPGDGSDDLIPEEPEAGSEETKPDDSQAPESDAPADPLTGDEVK